MKILFVTWDGPGQSYLESLFLPIFARLQEHGHSFDVVQFTWADAVETTAMRQRAASMGMRYTAYPVPRGNLVLSTLWMILKGSRLVARHIRNGAIDAVMPRSIIPAAMAILALRKERETRLLFDADGLMADERVDFAGWRADGLPYRVLRDIEAQAVRSAHAVMVRTARARDAQIARAGSGIDPARIHVVVNGRDEELFSPAAPARRSAVRRHHGLDADTPWIIYAGSIGPQYYPGEMLKFFSCVHRLRPDARLMILTANVEEMKAHLAEHEVSSGAVEISRVPPSEVPLYLASADLGLALRKPSFSMQAVAPIKVGEYLLCGLPVLSTAGVGDLDEQLGTEAAGKVLRDVGEESLTEAARWFVNDVLPDRERYRQASRLAGEEYFGLGAAVESYLAALRVCEGR